MMLTFLTLVAGATLGGGMAAGFTVLVVLAAVTLAVIAVANVARSVGRMREVLRD